ncbi:PAS domain-containing protein [Anaeromyxobacter oryzae]|nr:PAS domain-containing protein [Anaeromyxobacter oryzae]
MRVICSYCRTVIRDAPGAAATDVSHGMCRACDAYFERLWGGMRLGEYLDLLPKPVLVVDADGRVVAGNARLAQALGRSGHELRGLLGGEAMACVHSRLPEGCGKTVHCRECTIRRAVTKVSETQRPIANAPAWLKTDAGRVDLSISARPLEDFVEVTIEEMRPAA